MQINLTWDSSVAAAPAAFKTVVEAAAQVFDTQILNQITVTLAVGWGEDNGASLGTGALGTADPSNSLVTTTYTGLTSSLQKAAIANGVSSLVANLPTTDPSSGSGTWLVTSAEAKALGLTTSTSSSTTPDGYMGFATSNWNYATTDSNQLGLQQYDLFATALHEISHDLGRINGLSLGTNVYDALNLYTYASSGNIQLGATAPAYYSIDGGNTNLNNFNMSSGGDPADWPSTLYNDSFGGGADGVPGPMSATDWLVMESLGYHIAPTYILNGPAAVNVGAHDYLTLSTFNVAAGTNLNYSISGVTASTLDSNSLNGNVTVGSNGMATIDLGISSSAQLAAPVQATLSLGGSSYSFTVENTNNTITTLTGSGTTYTPGSSNETIQGAASDIISYNAYTAFFDASNGFRIVVASPGTIQVSYLPVQSNLYGIDTLIGPQRLSFSDKNIAFDLASNQSAGQAVEVLGATFGTSILTNTSVVGQAIKLFDSGDNMQTVAQIASSYVSGASDYSSFVKSVWLNVVGTQIDAGDLATYTNLLSSGQYTEASLLALAAATTANQNHIGLVGMASQGISYTPA
ncbi:MAG: NF038122 family metalloprotease [Betaproteobacteria bacterium]|nr:NF038122 family metalloprotease [Betaproteobacteria bacterium]